MILVAAYTTANPSCPSINPGQGKDSRLAFTQAPPVRRAGRTYAVSYRKPCAMLVPVPAE